MISVCMATFNGEKYLEEQINSILPQLQIEDELVISDDGSTDSTLALLQKYAEIDQRIKIVSGPQKGVIANFEHAIRHSQGKLLFLADQDDVWLPQKVSVIKNYFAANPENEVVVTDLIIVDEQLQTIEPSYFAYRNVQTGVMQNLIRNSYIGAGMAFRDTLKETILPIPDEVPMHDMWIGLLGKGNKKTTFVHEQLTLYRRHEKNASEIETKATLYQQLKWRTSLISALVKRKIIGK